MPNDEVNRNPYPSATAAPLPANATSFARLLAKRGTLPGDDGGRAQALVMRQTMSRTAAEAGLTTTMRERVEMSLLKAEMTLLVTTEERKVTGPTEEEGDY